MSLSKRDRDSFLNQLNHFTNSSRAIGGSSPKSCLRGKLKAVWVTIMLDTQALIYHWNESMFRRGIGFCTTRFEPPCYTWECYRVLHYRQQLSIDSKPELHIAEDKKRADEAWNKISHQGKLIEKVPEANVCTRYVVLLVFKIFRMFEICSHFVT